VGVSDHRRAGGTRTIWDVLRHPLDVIRDPKGTSPSKVDADLNALAAGESREVSCFLRGDAPELPDKFSQGTLLVGPNGMAWRPYWRHRKTLARIPPLARIEEVRKPGGPGERNIKKNLFKVVAATGPDGRVEFAVPGVGPELIRRAVESDNR